MFKLVGWKEGGTINIFLKLFFSKIEWKKKKGLILGGGYPTQSFHHFLGEGAYNFF
jgi:hypothetical protein